MSRRGFVQIRRGLEDHLLAGRIGAFEAGVYLVLHLQADFETGVWTGSAPRLMGTAPRGASLRDMQRSLARLEKIGFIRSFHRHGKRGNYRVLIHKFEPQFGALRGKRLNAGKSESWESPVYEPCAVVDAETDAESVAEDAPYPKEDLTNKKKKKTLAPAEPSPLFAEDHPWKTGQGNGATHKTDPRFQPIIDRFYVRSRAAGIEPDFDASDAGALARWLKGSHLALETILQRLDNSFDSTDPFPLKPGFRLREFLAHSAKYASGPIHKAKTMATAERMPEPEREYATL